MPGRPTDLAGAYCACSKCGASAGEVFSHPSFLFSFSFCLGESKMFLKKELKLKNKQTNQRILSRIAAV